MGEGLRQKRGRTLTIFLAIVVFTIIILVHEIGHFWAARRAGIEVIEFSLGMGPRLLKFTDKRGTMFSLKLFPIGGSCRFLAGDETDEEETEGEGAEGAIVVKPEKVRELSPNSFNAKPVRWRMLVILGGALANFIFAFLVATIISMFNAHAEPNILGFTEGSPAAASGMMEGDRILRMDGRRIVTRGDVNLAMMSADGSPMEIIVRRDGERIPLTLNPMFHETEQRWMLGIFFTRAVGVFMDAPEGAYERRMGFFESFQHGYQTVGFYIRATFTGLGRLIRYGLNFDELMGPIGIVDTVGGQIADAYTHEHGGAGAAIWTMLSFTVLLSANLGVMNLLPIPALDGGHMVFLIIEAIRKKPVPPERMGLINLAGIVLLMGFILLVAFHDIMRFF